MNFVGVSSINKETAGLNQKAVGDEGYQSPHTYTYADIYIYKHKHIQYLYIYIYAYM